MENRPNIITIGIAAGGFVQLVLWAWNGFVTPKGYPPLGANEAAGLTTLLTFAAQYADRITKRSTEHVLRKYG